VIYDVDTALRTLIERDGVDGSGVEVVFDAPTKDWASRRNAPTVDVYLYDIREDLRRRERGFRNEYDNGVVIARHLPPRHFKLSYLVTAWTQRAEDEHRLLSALLACFLKCDAIPRELLDGSSLGELGLPVALSVGLPPPEDRSFADVWSALGGELKPSLDLVVTAPTTTGQRTETGPPVTVPPRISIGGGAGWPPREIKVTREKERGLEDASKPAPGDRHGPETGSAVDLGAATPRRSRRAPRRKPGEGP
jgi:Pvc16 N-terminal domain